MHYDVLFVNVGDVIICACEVKGFVEKVLVDAWVEFLDVKVKKT